MIWPSRLLTCFLDLFLGGQHVVRQSTGAAEPPTHCIHSFQSGISLDPSRLLPFGGPVQLDGVLYHGLIHHSFSNEISDFVFVCELLQHPSPHRRPGSCHLKLQCFEKLEHLDVVEVRRSIGTHRNLVVLGAQAEDSQIHRVAAVDGGRAILEVKANFIDQLSAPADLWTASIFVVLLFAARGKPGTNGSQKALLLPLNFGMPAQTLIAALQQFPLVEKQLAQTHLPAIVELKRQHPVQRPWRGRVLIYTDHDSGALTYPWALSHGINHRLIVVVKLNAPLQNRRHHFIGMIKQGFQNTGQDQLGHLRLASCPLT
mmetsp:Transcript_11943/g.28502  ORF Transcript_11943/g.28502 Transcript_11943/m.28502 type:complete len:315 (+) Transcript_11943:1384-2328(+)